VETAASRRAALVGVTIMSFASTFMLSGVNIGLPAIGQEFSASALLLTWTSTVYSLAMAVLLLPSGKLADIYGRKRLYMIGVAIYAVSSLLCALATSAPMLLALRIPQGFGAALITATSTAILTSVYPASERGRVLGINTAAVYLGLSAGPFLGGMIVEALGWRAVFWTNVPLAVLSLIYTRARVQGEWADSRGDAFDARGAAVYAVAVVCLIVGLGQLPAARGIWIALVALAAGIVFIRSQGKRSSPLLDLSIFRGNRVFTMSSLAALINYAATASVTFLMSLYLQYIKALSPSEAGLVLIAQPIVQAAFSPLAGRLSDRVEARYVASLGMALTAAGIIMLTVLDGETTLAYITGALVVLGLGFALFSSPNVSALMGAVRRRHYGVASSLVALMRTLGQMLSMAMVMVLFTIYMGDSEVTPELYPQFLASARVALVISAVLCSLGVLASLSRGRNALGEEQPSPALES